MPKMLWANRINTAGALYAERPVKVYLDQDKRVYWDREGNFDVPAGGPLGKSWENVDGCIFFASLERKHVELWTSGVLSGYSAIRAICNQWERRREA